MRKSAFFLAYKAPYEETFTSESYIDSLSSFEILSNDIVRSFPISQTNLFLEGTEASRIGRLPTLPMHGMNPFHLPYKGNKWGGHYLRAPNIFHKILEKGGDKFVRLGDIAEVKFGIKTGANEFFYLTEEKINEWNIEKEYLSPIIKSSTESKSTVIDNTKLKFKLFTCSRSKKDLIGSNALQYINWGESSHIIDGKETRAFHLRPSTKNRKRWYDIGVRKHPPLVSPCSMSDIYRSFTNTNKVLVDKRLYEIYPINKSHTNHISASLNSTLTTLFMEIGSRTGLGQGLIDMTVYEVENCLLLRPEINISLNPIKRNIESIAEEIKKQDRIDNDSKILKAIGVTASEQDELYESLLNMVSKRLKKSKNK